MEKLTVEEATHKTSDDSTTKSKLEADVAQEELHKALQDLAKLHKVADGLVYEWVLNHGYNQADDSYERQVAKLRPSIFQEGWLACLKELSTPMDHPTWTTPAPEVELPNLP